MEQGNGAIPALEGKALQGQFVQTHRTFIRRMEAAEISQRSAWFPS